MKQILFLLLLCAISSCDFFKEPAQLIGWGDSMMKGSGGKPSILEVISDELDIRTENFAIGGIKSDAIAVLQGGKPMQLVFKNNEIKESGSSEITYYNREPINFQTEQYREGYIDSTEGKIERLSEKDNIKKTIGYQFISERIETSIKVEDTVVFQFKDAITYQNTWSLIWAGRNDKKSGDHLFQTRDNIQAMIDYMGENAKNHYLVLSVCNGIADNEYKGSVPHTNITNLNTVLKESFGDHFIDIRSYMVHKAIYDMNISPTEQDLGDIKKDCIPRSLLSDHVHFNTLGYEAAGKYLAQIIKEKGWIVKE